MNQRLSLVNNKEIMVPACERKRSNSRRVCARQRMRSSKETGIESVLYSIEQMYEETEAEYRHKARQMVGVLLSQHQDTIE